MSVDYETFKIQKPTDEQDEEVEKKKIVSTLEIIKICLLSAIFLMCGIIIAFSAKIYKIEKSEADEEHILVMNGTMPKTENSGFIVVQASSFDGDNEDINNYFVADTTNITIGNIEMGGNGTNGNINTNAGQQSQTSTTRKTTTTTKAAVQQTVYSGIVNINTASKEQLMSLNGIGEVKAQAIIDYRNTFGAFSSVDELLEVNGIGSKTLEKIRSRITV